MTKRNFKIFVVGDSLSGKSSLIHAYVGEELPQNMIKASYGLDFRIIPYKSCTIQLWDTISIPKYFSITKSFLRSAHAILICIPLNDPFAVNTLDFYLKTLLEEEKGFGWGKRRVKVLFTKCDLEMGFSWETMMEHLERWELAFGRVSAFRGVGVKEEIEALFEELNMEGEEGGRRGEERKEGRRKGGKKEEGGKKKEGGNKKEGGKKKEEEKKDVGRRKEGRKKKDDSREGGAGRNEEEREKETVQSEINGEEMNRRPICHCF